MIAPALFHFCMIQAAVIPPPGTRSWECVPSVIRNDGVDVFMLVVRVDAPVSRITLKTMNPRLRSSFPIPIELRDDGQGGDAVSGDLAFTAGPFTYNGAIPMTRHFWGSADSPQGLDGVELGDLIITETDATETKFLLGPQVGVLSKDVALIAPVKLMPDIAVTKHLANVNTDGLVAQRFLRRIDNGLASITTRVLSAVPDMIDQVNVFTTCKLEKTPFIDTENFTSAEHCTVKVDWDGGGRARRDDTARFGSRGALHAVNAIDVGSRGLYTGNVLHEMLHLWGAYLDSSLGLTTADGHYRSRTSVGSIIGGFLWLPDAEGYFLQTAEGVNGAHRAAPLDRYLMGLLDGSQVPPIMRYDDALPNPLALAGQRVTPVSTVTIEQIQAIEGIRTPGPDSAQKNFRIAFVIESGGRLLHPVEMTYYEVLAKAFAAPVPDDAPDPYCGFNWVSIARYFGEGSTWSTVLPRYFDFDADNDVDQDDFGHFRACETGPAVAMASPSRCADADADNDGDVDQSDFGLLQACMGSPSPCFK